MQHTIRTKCPPLENLSKSDFKWLLWPWEWGQGQIHGMSWKALLRGIIWYMNCRLICITLWNIAISISHWLTLERWTLAYISEVKGHSDLILWLQQGANLRCSHATLEGYRSIGVKTCHPRVYGQPDERTNGRTDGRTDWVTLSLLELLIAAKNLYI